MPSCSLVIGMYTTGLVLLSDQLALRRAVDVIANNVANSGTTGFKREGVQFETYVMRTTPTQSTNYVYDRATYRDVSPGTISKTGNPLDLAIEGPGYFEVMTPQGIQYTRNGAFRTDHQGQLVTSSGHVVLTDGGQGVTFPEDAFDITVSRDGYITCQSGTTSSRTEMGKLAFVKFENAAALNPTDGSLLSTTQLPTSAASDGAILQGAREDSNVKPVLEITDLIQIQRAYERASKLVGDENRRLSEAIDKLSQTSSA